jgi:hypothetical protein
MHAMQTPTLELQILFNAVRDIKFQFEEFPLLLDHKITYFTRILKLGTETSMWILMPSNDY